MAAAKQVSSREACIGLSAPARRHRRRAVFVASAIFSGDFKIGTSVVSRHGGPAESSTGRGFQKETRPFHSEPEQATKVFNPEDNHE
jgi:hypothetical protein